MTDRVEEASDLGSPRILKSGQIDQLVYELYGPTDDEIRIVEEATER